MSGELAVSDTSGVWSLIPRKRIHAPAVGCIKLAVTEFKYLAATVIRQSGLSKSNVTSARHRPPAVTKQ